MMDSLQFLMLTSHIGPTKMERIRIAFMWNVKIETEKGNVKRQTWNGKREMLIVIIKAREFSYSNSSFSFEKLLNICR